MTDSESKEFLKNLERRSRCEKKWDVSLLLRAIKDTLKEVPWNAGSLDQTDPDGKGNTNIYTHNTHHIYIYIRAAAIEYFSNRVFY